jgi:hypothetical protein
MITLNENALGLAICGPVLVSLLLGWYVGLSSAKREVAYYAKIVWAIAVVVTLAGSVVYLVSGFSAGVQR